MMLFRKLLATLGLGAAFMMVGADVALAQVPEGKVAIHYNRPAGDYDGWGLHSWESFQKAEEAGQADAKKNGADRTLSTISWMAPLKPASKTDFGVVFHLGTDEFSNGRVNYIIHKGDSKDQGGKDMFFMHKETKEIWVNQGDANIYKSKDEALAARKK